MAVDNLEGKKVFEVVLDIIRETLYFSAGLSILLALYKKDKETILPGLRLMGWGFLLIGAENVMHSMSDILGTFPRTVPLSFGVIAASVMMAGVVITGGNLMAKLDPDHIRV